MTTIEKTTTVNNTANVQHKLCVRCGYHLTSSEAIETCPECGFCHDDQTLRLKLRPMFRYRFAIGIFMSAVLLYNVYAFASGESHGTRAMLSVIGSLVGVLVLYLPLIDPLTREYVAIGRDEISWHFRGSREIAIPWADVDRSRWNWCGRFLLHHKESNRWFTVPRGWLSSSDRFLLDMAIEHRFPGNHPKSETANIAETAQK